MNKSEGRWVTVAEYVKLKGLSSTQLVYNWIALGKLKKNKEWREITEERKLKQIFYKD